MTTSPDGFNLTFDLTGLTPAEQAVMAANGKSMGMTAQEYLSYRGGVDLSGTNKYGDAIVAGMSLTGAEYKAAMSNGGVSALNAATVAKELAYYTANPSAIPNNALQNAVASGRMTAAQAAAMYGTNPNVTFSQITAKLNTPTITQNADGTTTIQYPNGNMDRVPSTMVSSYLSQSGYSYNASTGAVSSSGIGTASGTGNVNGVSGTSSSSPVAGLTGTEYNNRLSVYSAMADRFNKYGLTGLADKIKQLAMDGASDATITLQLQDTPEYQARFSANADRIKAGLTALTPAEYVTLEDTYRQVLRAYGLTQFDNDAYVKQFISNDMSPTELSNRVVTAVQRVQNADPLISKTLKDYYGIGSSDLVAYVLDPTKQFQKIERQVAAAEIGSAASAQGLQSTAANSELLASQGITQAQAKQGYATIADVLPTATKLSGIYSNQAVAYNQATAEQDVFNSLASAQRARQSLSALEQGTFSGSSGAAKGAFSTGYLNRDQATGQF